MAWYSVPFISPFAWGSSPSATPTNTNPTRRFSVSRQGTRFTVDGSPTTSKASSQRLIFDTDGSGTIFSPDDAGTRFTGDES